MAKFKVALISSFIFLISSLSSLAQSATDPVEMADTLRSDGKIYVVVTVLSIVFIGIVISLISLDRKVGRLEKKLAEKK